MNYLDFILGLILLVAIKTGYSRGLISLIAGVSGKILTVISAFYIAKPLAEVLSFKIGAKKWLAGKLMVFFPPAKILAEADMGRITSQKLPELLDKMSLPPLLKFKVMERTPELMANGSASVTAIINELALQSADMLLQLFSFFLVLVGGGLLIRFLIFTVDRLLQGTLIDQLNRLLGMCLSLSLALGCMMLGIGLTAPLILVPQGEPGFLAELVKGSYLYPRFLEAYGLILGAIISY